MKVSWCISRVNGFCWATPMPSGGEQHQIIECVVPADTCFIGTPVNEARSWGVQTVEIVFPIPHCPF